MAGGSLTVKSPEYVVGQDSGETREIDVSVRGKFASTEIFVMFECRRREGVEDVRWVEQVATKRGDVKASRAVMVSSSGFSAGARRMADRLNVELRTVRELTPAELAATALPHQVQSATLTLSLAHLGVGLTVKGLPADKVRQLQLSPEVGQRRGVDFEKWILHRKIDGTPVSVLAAAAHFIALNGPQLLAHLVGPLSTGKASKRMQLRANYLPSDRYQMETAVGRVDIEALTFAGDVTAEVTGAAATKATEYLRDDGTVISRNVSVLPSGDASGEFSLHELHREEGVVEVVAAMRAVRPPKPKVSKGKAEPTTAA